MNIGIKHRAALFLLAVLLMIPASPLSVSGHALAASALPADLQGHWAEEVLSRWLEQGLISGFADGKIRPDQPVTRAEWMAMVNGRFGLAAEAGTLAFADVKPAAWYAAAAAAAVRQGYITGYADGTLRPNSAVTRAEAAVMLGRLGQLEPAVEAASFTDSLPAWSKDAVGAVVGAGWMNGYSDGTFRGATALTRAEAAVTLDRTFAAIQKAEKSESLSGDMDRPGVYGPTEGTAEISGDAAIRTDGVTLQNTVVKGNLTIAEDIGSGEVHLWGVTVEGQLRVIGGGINSVYLWNTAANQLVVDKEDGKVRIVASGDTTLDTTDLFSGAILEEHEMSGGGQGFVLINVASQAAKSSLVQLRGEAETVRVAASGIRLELLSGQIGRLEVLSGAINNVVYLAQGTKIIVAVLSSPVTFEGPGQVLQKILGYEVQGGSGRRSHSGGGSTTPTNPPDPPDPEPTVTKLVYSPEKLEFDGVGHEISVALTAVLSNGAEVKATETADWYSEDEAVATVAQGTATSQGEGETWIGAKYGGLTVRIPVKVSVPQTPVPTVTKLVYSPEKLEFDGLGEQARLTLKALLSDGSEADVTEAVLYSWDPTIITFENGVFTSFGEGESSIFALYQGLSVRIPVKVSVPPAAAPAYRAALSATPGDSVAGAEINLTLRVEKSDGSLDTGFSGTKKITISGVEQALDSSYGTLAGTILTGSSGEADLLFTDGEATFTFALNKADLQRLAFAVEGVVIPTDEFAITIAPAAAAQLQIATQPSGSVASGETFAVQPVVEVMDAYGNPVKDSLSVGVSVSGETAALTGTTSVQTTDGRASFTDLGLVGGDSTVTLQFTAGSLPSAASSPITVRAFSAGDGTADTPYVITTAAQLDSIRYHLNGHFVLGGDIDLSGYSGGLGWTPIGISNAGFTGTLDGQGFTIRRLTSLRPGGASIGLFGYIDGATITNLNLSDVNVLGYMYVGGLVGYMNTGTVSGVHAENVTINGTSENLWFAGGLIGNMAAGTINRSSATAVNLNATYYLGGLVGATGAASSITESYSSGELFINGANLGGLVGTNSGTITDSYSLANITGASSTAGGLLGINRGAVLNSYAAGSFYSNAVQLGGLIGATDGGAVTGSYYDSDATGQTDTGKGMPKTTAEMQQQSTFASSGWNFTSTWAIDAGGYPYLKWQRP
ncbi:S-layer homology domain-containing protein [Paenibacillus macerans]|uniref:S-layer homology domain-containing protein n=1 Tax=Paenibacillus macerans TaxID=44252 RepID=UPI001F0F2B47|nr:S-layer homology domain-containing protein [Paenibacillus macerans]UMV45600.1 S-layer homology domain-containing protein [Paenibacillus macerans]